MPRRLRRGGMSNLGSGLDARYPDWFLFLVFKSPAACGGVLYFVQPNLRLLAKPAVALADCHNKTAEHTNKHADAHHAEQPAAEDYAEQPTDSYADS